MKKAFLTFLIMLLCHSAHSATVGAVQGKKAIILIEPDELMPGEEFYVLNPVTRKRSGILRIRQVKDRKALADILRGQAVFGYILQVKTTASEKSPGKTSTRPVATSEDSLSGTKYGRELKDSYGILGGILMNSMDATISYRDSFNISTNGSASMSGMGFGLLGFYNYVISPNFIAHMSGGLEQFKVSGTANSNACGGSAECDANINYLSGYGQGRWYPELQSDYRFWMGAGLGFLYAASKTSSALNSAQITTNQVVNLGIGADIYISHSNYVPVTLEYNYFPASKSVTANMIMIKAGFAWSL